MGMERRDFLKKAAVTVGGAAIAAVLVATGEVSPANEPRNSQGAARDDQCPPNP